MNSNTLFECALAYQEALPSAWGLSQFGQIGMVVDDPVAASAVWGPRLGIRTWYRPRITGYRTRASGVFLDQTLEIVIGYSGHTQIELLSVRGPDLGVFEAPMPDDAGGVHHLGFFVRDIDQQVSVMRSRGFEPAQKGTLFLSSNVKTRFAYWNMRASGGGVVELIEQRFSGFRIGMPEWLVRIGSLTGHFERMG